MNKKMCTANEGFDSYSFFYSVLICRVLKLLMTLVMSDMLQYLALPCCALEFEHEPLFFLWLFSSW